MKKFIIFILAFFVLVSPVLALDEFGVVEDPVDQLPTSIEEISNSDVYEVVDIETFSVSPVTPSDASGLKAVLLQFLGNYDPVVVEYRYLNNNSSTYQYLREVQPDYVWMASFILLALFVYCIFRLGGALIG